MPNPSDYLEYALEQANYRLHYRNDNYKLLAETKGMKLTKKVFPDNKSESYKMLLNKSVIKNDMKLLKIVGFRLSGNENAYQIIRSGLSRFYKHIRSKMKFEVYQFLVTYIHTRFSLHNIIIKSKTIIKTLKSYKK